MPFKLPYIIKKLCQGGGKILIFSLLWLNQGYANDKFEPLISIVLPTYNRADLLPRSLDSLLAQTYKNIEIIVVDDASSDATPVLLKTYQQKSKKIKVITHRKNQGVSSARNTGNKIAKGQYIAVMDSDDFAHPDWIKLSVEIIQKNKDAHIFVVKKQAFTKEDLSDMYVVKSKNHFILFGNAISNVGNIFNADFVRANHITYPINYACGEDYHFWIQMILKGAKIKSVDTKEALVSLRKHTSNGPKYAKFCKKAIFDVREILTNTIGILLKNQKDPCPFVKAYIQKYPHTFDKEETQQLIKFSCNNSIHKMQYKKRRFFIF